MACFQRTRSELIYRAFAQLCSDGTYYTGSTVDLVLRLEQHQAGEGANYTRRRLPVSLIYAEEYGRIEDAFRRHLERCKNLHRSPSGRKPYRDRLRDLHLGGAR